MRRFIALSRYLIFLPSAGSFAAATALLLYGTMELAYALGKAATTGPGGKGAKTLALSCIEVVDLYLLATVFYIVALGLYELFIDEDAPVPGWLTINDLDDLKNKLTGVVILVMGVLFLGQVVTWDGERDLLPYGAAIALVIGALTYFLSQRSQKPKSGAKKPAPEGD